MNALRGRPLLALTAAVLGAHLWLTSMVLPSRLGDGAADSPRRRIEVAFVRELAPAAVPVAPPARPPLRTGRLAPPAAAASAPDLRTAAVAPAALASEPAWPSEAPDALPLPKLEGPALAVADAASAASATAGFDWPPSTRLSYSLSGNARGPVEGQARVEWLRAGTRYQVFMEASVGPAFAPLMTRRESSEGEITADGLSPRRYEMEMKAMLREPRRSVIAMDADQVRLPGGQVLPRPAALQDAVSQFVQMTWLFTVQPEMLVPGRSIEMALALPRRVEAWTYDVVATELLQTRAGPVDAVHVRPRRPARPGDFTAEVWIAPSLQNLPVRIIVRQDAETWIDLQIERLPEQAERGR